MNTILKHAVDLVEMLPSAEQDRLANELAEKAEKKVLLRHLRDAEKEGGAHTVKDVFDALRARSKKLYGV